MTGPVIGIVTLACTAQAAPDGPEETHESEARGVLQAGGLPVLVPGVVRAPGHLRQLVETLDGILVTCGGVHHEGSTASSAKPAEPSPPDGGAADTAIIRTALREALPILGICRGAEALGAVLAEVSRADVAALNRNGAEPAESRGEARPAVDPLATTLRALDHAIGPLVSADDQFAVGIGRQPSPAELTALIEALVRASDPYGGLDPSWILSQQ